MLEADRNKFWRAKALLGDLQFGASGLERVGIDYPALLQKSDCACAQSVSASIHRACHPGLVV